MINKVTLSQGMSTYRQSVFSKSRNVDLELDFNFKSGKLDLKEKNQFKHRRPDL